MRRALILVVVLAFLAGVLAVVDVLVKDGVQAAIADRIESRSPGSTASVRITSFPFVGRIAVSGTIPELRVRVRDLQAGSLRFATVDLDVHQLTVDRSQLTRGSVRVTRIRAGTVVASVAQADLDRELHVGVHLGRGTVSYAGLTVSPVLSVAGDEVSVGIRGLPTVSFRVPTLEVLPCVGAATVVPGALRLSCSFRSVPGILSGQTFHA